jgi:hypothetical protein
MQGESGVSATIATVLMIGVMVVLAAAVFSLLVQFTTLDPGAVDRIQYLPITSVDHVSELPPHPLNYDSRITLIHRGTKTLPNRELRAVVLRNGVSLDSEIPTLNGHDFIPVHPPGIQWIGGTGTRGEGWAPGEEVEMDFADGTFRPGDMVTVRIIHGPTGTTVSEDSARA